MPASAHKLNFKDVSDRRPFRTKHVPEGDYHAKIVQVDDHESEAGNTGWVWTIALTDGPGTGAKFPYYTMLTESNLWKVRNLLTATGLNVPKKVLKVDPNKAVGRTLGVTIEDDEYEGNLRSTIADTIPEDEIIQLDQEETEEEIDTDVEITDDLADEEEEVEIVEEDELEELEIDEL